MSHSGKLSPATIALIRQTKIDHMNWGSSSIRKHLGLNMRNQHVDKVMRNEIYFDPEYEQFALHIPGRKKYDTARAYRLRADECTYNCPICGMGYPQHGHEPFASQVDADQCCIPALQAFYERMRGAA